LLLKHPMPFSGTQGCCLQISFRHCGMAQRLRRLLIAVIVGLLDAEWCTISHARHSCAGRNLNAEHIFDPLIAAERLVLYSSFCCFSIALMSSLRSVWPQKNHADQRETMNTKKKNKHK
jgi:hypothetical protein